MQTSLTLPLSAAELSFIADGSLQFGDFVVSQDLDEGAEDAVVFIHGAYRDMLATVADRFRIALTTLAQPGALPAVFHCAAGKDRTGLLAALLLALAGCATRGDGNRAGVSGGYVGGALGGTTGQGAAWR